MGLIDARSSLNLGLVDPFLLKLSKPFYLKILVIFFVFYIIELPHILNLRNAQAIGVTMTNILFFGQYDCDLFIQDVFNAAPLS